MERTAAQRAALANAALAKRRKKNNNRRPPAEPWLETQDRLLSAGVAAGNDWSAIARDVSAKGAAKSADACRRRRDALLAPGDFVLGCVLEARTKTKTEQEEQEEQEEQHAGAAEPADEVASAEYLVRGNGRRAQQPLFDEHGRRPLLYAEFQTLKRATHLQPPQPGQRVAVAFEARVGSSRLLCCGQVLADGSVEPGATDYGAPGGDNRADWDRLQWLAEGDRVPAVWQLLITLTRPAS